MKTIKWIIENLEEGQVAKASLVDKTWYIKKEDNDICRYYGGKTQELIMMNEETINATYEIIKEEKSKKNFAWAFENLEEGRIAKAAYGLSEWYVIKKNGTMRYFYGGEVQRLLPLNFTNLQANYEIIEEDGFFLDRENEYRDYQDFKIALMDNDKSVLKYEKIEEVKDKGLIKMFLLDGNSILIDQQNYDSIKKNLKKVKKRKI